MMDEATFRELLSRFASEMKAIFGKKLIDISLFGSYAEGTQDKESDIDIMVFVDENKENLKNYHDDVVHIMSELSLEYGIIISAIIQNYQEFVKYREVLPFFKHVSTKGVKISA